MTTGPREKPYPLITHIDSVTGKPVKLAEASAIYVSSVSAISISATNYYNLPQSISYLSALLDVSNPLNASTGQALIWSSTKWIASSVSFNPNVTSLAGTGVFATTASLAAYETTAYARNTYAATASLQSYVLTSTNTNLSSAFNNHLTSAVHWDLNTLNTNYINASGDSTNAAFYFSSLSGTNISATTYLNLPLGGYATTAQLQGYETTAYARNTYETTAYARNTYATTASLSNYITTGNGRFSSVTGVNFSSTNISATNVTGVAANFNAVSSNIFYLNGGKKNWIYYGDPIDGKITQSGGTSGLWFSATASLLPNDPANGSGTLFVQRVALDSNGLILGQFIENVGATSIPPLNDTPPKFNPSLSSRYRILYLGPSGNIGNLSTTYFADSDLPLDTLVTPNLSSLNDIVTDINLYVLNGTGYIKTVSATTYLNLPSVTSLAGTGVFATTASLASYETTAYARNTYATTAALQSYATTAQLQGYETTAYARNNYVLTSTNSNLSSAFNSHLTSAVHWDLATLNTNYINASGDSASAAFYFSSLSGTTISATTYLNLPLGGYATTAQLQGYETTAYARNTYATTASLASYALTASLASYETTAYARNTYATTASLSNYITTSTGRFNDISGTGLSAITISATTYRNLPTSALSGLSDTNIVSPLYGQSLVWDNSKWTPSSVAGGGGGGGTPGGATTQVQYNSGGAFAGSPAMTFTVGTSTFSATNIVASAVTGTNYYVGSAIQFNTTTATLAIGQIAWNATEQTLDIQTTADTTLQVGQEQVMLVENKSGASIANGKVVYVSGTTGGSGKLNIGLASASSTNSETAFIVGVTTQTIADNSTGFVTTFGKVHGIPLPTAQFADGDIAYLGDTPGELRNYRPGKPGHGFFQMGRVIRAHDTNGILFVTIRGSLDMDEIHDVASAIPGNGQVLVYNTTSSLYIPNNIDAISGINNYATTASLAAYETTAYARNTYETTGYARNTYETTGYARNTYATTASLQSYVLTSTNNNLSSAFNNHLTSAVHWDLNTLNTNYINASGDSANADFYFSSLSGTTISATTYLNLPVSSLSGLNDVLNPLNPTNGQVLTWSSTKWIASSVAGGGGGGTPGGANTQVQFNNNGSFSGVSNFTYDNSTQTLSITTVSATNYTNLPASIVPNYFGILNAMVKGLVSP